MSTPAANDNRVAFRRLLLGTTAAALCAAITALALNSPSSAQAPGKIPELASTSFAWLGGGEWRDPPAGMRGPIRNDSDFPYNGNNDRVGEQVTVRMGNWKDPVLKPWAAAKMKATNDEVIAGIRGQRPWPLPSAVEVICGLDRLWRTHRHWMSSLDVNPLIVTEDGLVAVDALFLGDRPKDVI